MTEPVSATATTSATTPGAVASTQAPTTATGSNQPESGIGTVSLSPTEASRLLRSIVREEIALANAQRAPPPPPPPATTDPLPAVVPSTGQSSYMHV